MQQEEEVKSQLVRKFAFLDGKVTVRRSRRIFADVPAADFAVVFDYAVKELGFSILCTITGLDEGPTLGFIYHLAAENGMMLNLHTNAPKGNPVIQSVTPYFRAAAIYERELVDLLGAKVEGVPCGCRYPLPDDWPAGQYPLRKDWKPQIPDKMEMQKDV